MKPDADHRSDEPLPTGQPIPKHQSGSMNSKELADEFTDDEQIYDTNIIRTSNITPLETNERKLTLSI